MANERSDGLDTVDGINDSSAVQPTKQMRLNNNRLRMLSNLVQIQTICKDIVALTMEVEAGELRDDSDCTPDATSRHIRGYLSCQPYD